MHLVRVDAADRHHLLHFHDADLAGHRAGRVEVARGLAEHQVAGLVGLPGLDQGNVGAQRGFHHVVLAVELTGFLAFGHHRAIAGSGEERRDTRTTGTQAFGQGALRIELQLQLAGQELPFELLVLAHVGRNHLLDLPGFQQLAQAEAIHAGVVGDHGQALGATVAQRGDQCFRNTAQAEATHGQNLAISDHALQGIRRRGETLAARAAGSRLLHLYCPTR
ncbi:hypothetical protein D3C73_865790 [compost metagenome]